MIIGHVGAGGGPGLATVADDSAGDHDRRATGHPLDQAKHEQTVSPGDGAQAIDAIA